MFGTNMHTVADPPILNFILELGSLAQNPQAFAARGNVMEDLLDLNNRFAELTAKTGEEWAAKWNFLGPMTTFQDSGIHSSFEPTRRAQGAERMLGFSVFNRSHTFNLFSPTLRRGQQLFFVAKEIDLASQPNFLDPHGNAVVARTSTDTKALQVIGFSEDDCPFPMGSTAYQPDDFKVSRGFVLQYSISFLFLN